MSGNINCTVQGYQKVGSKARQYRHFDMHIDGSNESELRFFFEGCITKMKDAGLLPQEISDTLIPADTMEDAKRGAQ